MFPSLLCGAGTDVKAKPSEYEVQQPIPSGTVAADFLVRTFFGQKQSFVTDDYLVVEVAIFPAKEMTVSASHFSLRFNNKKSAVFAQFPGMVAASIKYPDWAGQQGGSASGGAGGGGIGGPPAPVERFPGDRRDPRSRTPRPPTASTDAAPGVERPNESPVQLISERALVEGPTKHPVSGYLYFPYKGNVGKLKTIDLVYQTPGTEPVLLRLRDDAANAR
jgi:hypothetical protein